MHCKLKKYLGFCILGKPLKKQLKLPSKSQCKALSLVSKDLLNLVDFPKTQRERTGHADQRLALTKADVSHEILQSNFDARVQAGFSAPDFLSVSNLHL